MPQYEDVYDPPVLDSTFAEKIDELKEALAPPIPDFVSDAFSVSRAYAVGEYCIYENHFYKFTSAKSAGAWDSTKVQETTLAAEQSSTNASLTQFNIHDILSTVRSTYSAIDSDGRIVIVELNKYIAVMSIQIKTTSAISSGSVTISDSNIPKARTKVHGALSTNDGKTGWVQYEDGVLFIRAQASTTSAYLCGQIVFPIKQS